MKHLVKVICFLLLGLITLSYADNAGTDDEVPIILTADTLSFDQDKNIIVAQGNVEVIQKNEVLTADQITYDQQNDLISASGNIILHRPSGDIFFGSYAELQDRFKNGVIKELRVLMADNVRLASNDGKRTDGIKTQFNKVISSPCKLCKQDPSQPPLWQIKAETALWDEEKRQVSYTDATFEFWGTPIFYMPYFSHSDPKIKQKSGLLPPRIDGNEDLGLVLSTPYYHVFSRDKDMTLTPVITTKRGQFLDAEYRQRFSSASLILNGSGGYSQKLQESSVSPGQSIPSTDRKDEWRGHIDSEINWHLTENWRVEANALRATDKTYLRQFPFYGHTNENVLTSAAKLEGFYGLNYIRAQGLLYQGLRKDDRQKRIPKIGPLIDINYISPQQFWHSRWTADFNTLNLFRNEGADVSRLSSTLGWSVPYTSPWGDHYNLSLRIRGDIYYRDDFVPKGQTAEVSGTVGRFFPQLYLEWEYPWITIFPKGHLILSPVATIVVSPKLGDQGKFPNEDSFIIEPTDHNILRASRFPGLDLIDDGSRINFGLKADGRYGQNIKSKFFLGQTASFYKPASIFDGTGFDKRWSDYVGRFNVNLFRYVDFRYRFRANRNSFKMLRNELSSHIGVPEFKVHVNYLKLPRYQGEDVGQGAEQIELGASSAFSSGWSASVFTTREIGKKSRSLSYSGNLTFENECLAMKLQMGRSFYNDLDFKPGKYFQIVLALKTSSGVELSKFSHRRELGSMPRHGSQGNPDGAS